MTRNILNPSQSYLKVTAIFCQRLSVTQLKQQRKKMQEQYREGAQWDRIAWGI